MHRRATASGNKLRASGLTQDIKTLYTTADQKKYSAWCLVPCPQWGVCVTRPELIHGSMASSGSSVRRTVLPWYVAISKEGLTLDNKECDSYATVLHVHLTQTAPRTTSSGHFNRYGKIPHKFYSLVKLASPTSVGQALVCQQSWADLEVICNAKLMLGPNREMAKNFINRHWMASLTAFKAAYKMQKEVEIAMFKDDSYFNNL